ncbi:MAG: hypothetical protein V4629_13520 [Pseudomonadota bacterium]
MKRKPDILVWLTLMFSLGVFVSGYTMGEATPEEVAQNQGIIIR